MVSCEPRDNSWEAEWPSIQLDRRTSAVQATPTLTPIRSQVSESIRGLDRSDQN